MSHWFACGLGCRSVVSPSSIRRLDEWQNLAVAELRRLVDSAARRPSEAQSFEACLVEICKRDAGGVRWFRLRERLLMSQGREADIQDMWRAELAKANLEPSVCRLGIVRSFQRSGQSTGILQLLAELELRSEEAETVSAEEAAVYATVASEVGSDLERAHALKLTAVAAKLCRRRRPARRRFGLVCSSRATSPRIGRG